MKRLIILLLSFSIFFSCTDIEKYRREYRAQLGSNSLGVITDKPPISSEEISDAILLTTLIYLAKNQRTKYYSTLYPNIDFSNNVVIAGDGTYLGKMTFWADPDSILNQFGEHGSTFSSKSIWNKFGTYGSSFSPYSAFNPIATDPPRIYLNGVLVGYLTVNPFFINRINPYSIDKKH